MTAETIISDSPWWRVADAAAYCKVHKATIFKAAREGKLQHVRVGGRRKILLKREYLDDWLLSQIVRVKSEGGAR